jgi:hypothetical protein
VGGRGAEFGEGRLCESADGETSDDGRRLIPAEPVKKPSQDSKHDAELAGIAGVVVFADRQRAVVERGQLVAVFGPRLATHVWVTPRSGRIRSSPRSSRTGRNLERNATRTSARSQSRDNEMRRPPGGKLDRHEGRCDVEENRPAGDHGADNLAIPPGNDYEYDEAHDVPPGPIRESPTPHRVEAPPGIRLDEGGDYGYDEAHDFCARRPTKT